MKSSIQHIFQIYKTDIKNILTNWVTAVIISGLVFLPSLYAWFNIYASMDPYANTANMKIAIVNEDSGAFVNGNDLNVGNEIITNLAANENFSWHFTSRVKALNQLENGDFFAAIIVPNDFSQNLTSIMTDTPTKAQIDYYVNEKINPIAPKITSKGASVITGQISSEFVSTVNGTIFDIFNTVGIEVEKKIPDINKFENYIFTIEQHLPEIESKLTQVTHDAKEAIKLVNGAMSQIPEVQKVTDNGLSSIDSGLTLINKVDTMLQNLTPLVKENSATIKKIKTEFSQLLERLQNTNSNGTTINQIQKQLTEAQQLVKNSIQSMETLQKVTSTESAAREQLEKSIQNTITQLQQTTSEESAKVENNKLIQQLQSVQKQLQANSNLADYTSKSLTQLNQLKSLLTEVSNNVQQLDKTASNNESIKNDIAHLQQLAQNITNHLDQFFNNYVNQLEPKINSTLAGAKNTLTSASTMLTKVKNIIPQAAQLLQNTQGHLSSASNILDQVQPNLPSLNKKFVELAQKLRTLNDEADITEIVQLLKNDVNAERDFFEEPIKLEEHRLFPIANYGTSMTPFYTVLSIWVGCLLLISLLAVDIHHGRAYSIREVYFGRLLTFATLSLLQTIIIAIGDIILLDGSIHAPLYFVLFALFISFVFVTIVYTLVTVFGNVGKAMAIVMLVLQIAGSGGTYPVELLPKFFQFINPFLPFTYAIEMMREAVGGIIWSKIFMDVGVLLFVWLFFILFGFFFKKLLSEKMDILMRKSRESNIFH
ncbi:YhgE/Pip family protein [Lysinibacillus sp. NPDC097287]|uniref:YhgE/Pip family protein n=1 Tax=Lysinibacillus sp. NPDC097287 TaxID=3364144 RepID=UPI003821958D